MRVPLAVRHAMRSNIVPPPTVGCTKHTARCANARSYQYDLNDCCRGHLRQIVADTAAGLEALGMVWWIDYGTLLGAVRNPMLGMAPGIIPHDKDADAGFLWSDWPRAMRLRALLERKGYFVRVNPRAEMMKVHLSSTNRTHLDLFAWHRGPGKYFRKRYLTVDAYKGRDFAEDRAFPLTSLVWEGMTLPAPREPAAFCAFRYGPSWQTPIRANHDGKRR